MSTFYNKQFAEDWGFLENEGEVSRKPTNCDGIVERRGKFMFLEVKRGEATSEGQRRMLVALAKQPGWTVLVVHSRRHPADEFNARLVDPIAYEVFNPDGSKDAFNTNATDFKAKYFQWWSIQDRNVWLGQPN